MTTLVSGQVVRAIDTGRTYRLEYTDGHRWTMTILSHGDFNITALDDERPIGSTTRCTETWLRDRCVDVAPQIAPPCGDGPQTVRLVAADASGVWEHYTHDSVLEVVGWIYDKLSKAGPEWHAEWFGWICTDASAPDLTCRMVDGELVWAE